jgi:hypothetical protein
MGMVEVVVVAMAITLVVTAAKTLSLNSLDASWTTGFCFLAGADFCLHYPGRSQASLLF